MTILEEAAHEVDQPSLDFLDWGGNASGVLEPHAL
jgi:hypothetical protein